MIAVDPAGLRRFLAALFPEPDTFLRELVQNSMEALHAAVACEGGAKRRQIRIDVDPDASTLTVSDNGCGMSREELREKLGMIFRCGWGEHQVEALGVGQFGFGFFSSILVADRIKVRTRPLGDDAETWCWSINGTAGEIAPIEPGEPMDESGFEVVLHLSDAHRHFASSDQVAETLRGYLLFCPFRIMVGGADVPVATRAQWRRVLDDPRSEADLHEDIRKTFGWDKPPIAVLTSEDGVIAAAPPNLMHAPASKVHRHGVFVLETEIIPAPLNYVFAGVFNVDELAIRPDRKSFVEDASAVAFQRRVVAQAAELFRKISGEPTKAFAFFEGWLDPMIVAVLAHDELADLRAEMPLRRVGIGRLDHNLNTTWRKLTEGFSSDRVLFTNDPVEDRAMIEILVGQGELVLNLQNARERALARHCAEQDRLRLIEVKDYFLENQKGKAIEHPGLYKLFGELPAAEGYEIVVVRDDETRIPLRLMAEKGEDDRAEQLRQLLSMLAGKPLKFDLRAGAHHFAIVNLAHPAIATLAAGIDAGTDKRRLQTAAEVLLLSALVAEPGGGRTDQQIALARAQSDLLSHALEVRPIRPKGHWLRFSR